VASGLSLIWITLPELSMRYWEKHDIPPSGLLVLRPIFEPGTSRRRINNHPTRTFGFTTCYRGDNTTENEVSVIFRLLGMSEISGRNDWRTVGSQEEWRYRTRVVTLEAYRVEKMHENRIAEKVSLMVSE